MWSRAGCASSGSDAPTSPAFHSLPRTVPFERLWAREAAGQTGIVVDAVTSLGTEQFGSAGGVAFGGELAFLRRPAAIEARNAESGTIQWRWDLGGGGRLAGSALAVRDAVWTQTGSGEVVALRRTDGAELFRTDLGAAGPDPYSSYSGRVHDGMAADAEGLIVPSGDRLAALGPGGDAPGVLDPDKAPGGATTMTAQVRPRDVEFGAKAVISGEVRAAATRPRPGSGTSSNSRQTPIRMACGSGWRARPRSPGATSSRTGRTATRATAW